MWFIAWPIKDVKIQLFKPGGDSAYERSAVGMLVGNFKLKS